MATRTRTLGIKVTADAREAAKGLGPVDKALDDAGQSADTFGKRLKSAGNTVGKAFSGTDSEIRGLGSKLASLDSDAQQGLGGVAREATGLRSKLSRLGTDAGKDLGDGIRDGAKGSIDGIGDDLKGQLTDLVAAGGIGLAFAEGMDNELSADKFAAQLGLDPQRQSELGSAAGHLYADGYGQGLGDVNEAMRSVIQSGAVMEDAGSKQVEGITAKVMSLVNAFDQDLMMATNAAGQMVRTGLAKNADEALDILTRGLQNGANKADDLLETFNEYSTQFRELGLDGKQALGLITQGVKAGARDADVAADAIKEFAIRAQDGSESTADGFAMIGLSAEDMAQRVARGGPDAAAALDMTLDRIRALKDPTDQAAAAVHLFGTQSEDMQDAILAMDLSTAVSELGDVTGAAAEVDATMGDNLSTTLSKLKRDAMAPLVSMASTVAGAFRAIPPQLQSVIGGAAGIVGVAAPAIWAGSKLVNTYSSVKDTLDTVRSAFDRGEAAGGRFRSGMSRLSGLAPTAAKGLAAVGVALTALEITNKIRVDRVADQISDLADVDTANLDSVRDGLRTYREELEKLEKHEGKGRMFSIGGFNAFSTEGDADRQERIDQLRTKIAGLEEQEGSLESQERQLAASYVGTDRALDGLTQGTTDQVTALSDLSDALSAQFDPLFGMMDALYSNQDAQGAVIQAEKDLADARAAHGRNSAEAQAAEMALTQAQREATGSALSLNQAANTLRAGIQAGTVSLGQAKAQLGTWVSQGLIAQSTADVMARQFDEAAWSSAGMSSQMWGATGAANALGQSDPNVWATLTDHATGPLAWLKGRVDGLDGRQATVTINLRTTGLLGAVNELLGLIPKRAAGGPTDMGRLYLVGEEGPELWVSPSNGTIIPADQTAAALADRDPLSSLGAGLSIARDFEPEIERDPFPVMVGVAAAEAGGGTADPPTGDTYVFDLRGSVISSEAEAERFLATVWNRIVAKNGAKLKRPPSWR